MLIEQNALERILALLEGMYPEWKGFSDPRFEEQEIHYKQATVAKARELLSEEELRRLIQARDYDDVVRRCDLLGKDNNLLFQGVPRAGDLAILNHPELDREAFSQALLDLLHGQGDSPDRLQRFVDFTLSRGLPNKWTFPTYFLFISRPATDLFVKPATLRKFLQLIGHGQLYTSQPSGAAYRSFLGVGRAVQDALAGYGARDMVDVYSLMWVVVHQLRRLKKEGGRMKHRDEFAALYDRFVGAYLHTDAGRRHLENYAEGRRQGNRNVQEIVARRDAGEDVTDLVLRKLLPHADTQPNREGGVWIHTAPAVTKDIRSWFEGAGWTKPEDWPRIAHAILEFVERAAGRPDELAEACAEFAAKPYTKGFQAGMLSPILNALRPDTFLVINNKPLHVIRYFTGKKCTSSLADYPEVNAAGWELVDEVSDLVRRSAAGVDAPVADLVDIFSHWLVAIEKFDFDGGAQCWKIAPGEGASQWEACLEGGYIAIGWGELGDLSSLSYQEYKDRFLELYGTEDDQPWRFANQISEGDRIVANEGTTTVLGIGTVTGPYYYVEGEPYPHRLPVSWDDTTRRRVNEGSWGMTLQRIASRKRFEQILNAEPIDGAAAGHGDATTSDRPPANHEFVEEADKPINPEYPLTQVADETGLEIEVLERWVRAIERKGQAILYGPPGTGKTYVARHLARHLVGGTDGIIELVQFHPAYAYEDFVQGIRPRARPDGGLDYPLVPGRLLEFCERARNREGTCVLIIDEINRANLSRVFGELMYLLEYREEEIPLAGGIRFAFPENVRIIGTMNTADRSIALVDHALRRRFAFLSLQPKYDVLERYHAEKTGWDGSGLVGVLRELNRRIDDPHYEVGTSFFLREDIEDQIADIWTMEIEPFLEEYFFDKPEVVEQFRWSKVRGRIESE